MTNVMDKHSKDLSEELSDIFRNGHEYLPIYPDKVHLTLKEFKRFYLKSVELKDLDEKERRLLAAKDVLNCMYATIYDKDVHDVVSKLYHGDCMPLYKSYPSKLLFLK
jgi:hypothetical protein